MQSTPRILIVEHDRIAGESLLQTLSRHGYAAEAVRSAGEAIDAIERTRFVPTQAPFGVVIADQDVSGVNKGVGLVRQLHQDWPAVVPILISGYRKVEAAVQAMRLGAADYLLKPIVETELLDAAQRASQRHLLIVERELAQEDVAKPVEHAPESDGEQDGWQPMPLSEAMKAPERRILLAALEANGWNRGRTAEQLDINRTTLYKKIRQHRLDEPA